jgi:hypothetical protein
MLLERIYGYFKNTANRIPYLNEQQTAVDPGTSPSVLTAASRTHSVPKRPEQRPLGQAAGSPETVERSHFAPLTGPSRHSSSNSG